MRLTRDLRKLLLRADRQKTKTFLRSIVDSVVVGTHSVEINYSFPADNGNGKEPKASDILAWSQRRGLGTNARQLALRLHGSIIFCLLLRRKRGTSVLGRP